MVDASRILGVDETYISPVVFKTESGWRCRGYISRSNGFMKGSLVVYEVDGRKTLQLIQGMPKLVYMPELIGRVDNIDSKHIYIAEKLDGTNILSYILIHPETCDIETCIKTRGLPIITDDSEKGRDFYILLREYGYLHDIYRHRESVPYNTVYELYGSRNRVLIKYDVECAVKQICGVYWRKIVDWRVSLMKHGYRDVVDELFRIVGDKVVCIYDGDMVEYSGIYDVDMIIKDKLRQWNRENREPIYEGVVWNIVDKDVYMAKTKDPELIRLYGDLRKTSIYEVVRELWREGIYDYEELRQEVENHYIDVYGALPDNWKKKISEVVKTYIDEKMEEDRRYSEIFNDILSMYSYIPSIEEVMRIYGEKYMHMRREASRFYIYASRQLKKLRENSRKL